jgi:hypothetical protein
MFPCDCELIAAPTLVASRRARQALSWSLAAQYH